MPVYKDKERNTYLVKLYYTDWQGIKRQKCKRGFKLQREAKEWERLFLEQYAKNPDITFATLYKKYKAYKENRVKASTLESQCNAIELHILPFFKNKIVAEITPAEVVEWQNNILDQGFSANYARQLNAYLRMVFKYAVDFLGLSQSPVKSQICKPQKGNIDFWTQEEYKAFSDSIKHNIELFTAFEILFYTGMRKGELLALTLGDIDFENRKISINKTLAYVNGVYITQPPKTTKSMRIISVPGFLLEEIKAYTSRIYGIQEENRLFHRSRVWLGEAITYNHEKAGVKPIRVHDLRHSHASMLINLGANPLLIAERLGHEDVKETMNTYSHLFESHEKEIIDKLEKIKL